MTAESRTDGGEEDEGDDEHVPLNTTLINVQLRNKRVVRIPRRIPPGRGATSNEIVLSIAAAAAAAAACRSLILSNRVRRFVHIDPPIGIAEKRSAQLYSPALEEAARERLSLIIIIATLFPAARELDIDSTQRYAIFMRAGPPSSSSSLFAH